MEGGSMKNKKDYISLLVAIINVLIIILLPKILEIYQWYLRSWVCWTIEALIFIPILIFLILRFLHVKTTPKKVLIVILSIFFLIVSFIIFIFNSWIIKTDFIKEIDNKNYIGIKEDQFRARVSVDYYSKYNIFAYYKSNDKINEFYDNTRKIDKKYLTSITYFDENGKIINACKYDQKGNIISKKELNNGELVETINNEESSHVNNTNTDNSVKNNENQNDLKYYIENNKCYTNITGDTKEIITPTKAADIADKEAENPLYQYQGWKSEFYSRGKNNDDYLSIELLLGLDEISKWYHWTEDWKKEDYENKIMWKVRLFDENDPLTSLYIFVDALNGNIVGAGQSSD